MLATMLFEVFSTEVAMLLAKSAPGMLGGLAVCVGMVGGVLMGLAGVEIGFDVLMFGENTGCG